MKYVKNHLTRGHGIVMLGLLGVFTVWTFLITNAGVDEGAGHNARVLWTTLGVITGPLTGAISRNFQECCLRFSLQLMAICAPVLTLGIGFQFIGGANGKGIRALRMFLWASGWTAWFAGGIVSFLHALS